MFPKAPFLWLYTPYGECIGGDVYDGYVGGLCWMIISINIGARPYAELFDPDGVYPCPVGAKYPSPGASPWEYPVRILYRPCRGLITISPFGVFNPTHTAHPIRPCTTGISCETHLGTTLSGGAPPDL